MATTWTTRPETAADAVAIREVNLAALPSEEEADLVDALRASDAWIDGLSIVAEDSLPRIQKTGAGSAAIRVGLQAARALGENLVVVLGHADYYPRFAFIPASAFGIHASVEVPDEAVMALALDPNAETPRGTIAYPAAFGV